MFTLVGGGMKTIKNCGRPMSSVLPSAAKWVKDEVANFDPKANFIITKQGHQIEYNFMVVAVGLQLNFNKVSICSLWSTLHIVILIDSKVLHIV
jgi:NADH dehydrogenase FAD-containing subunit